MKKINFFKIFSQLKILAFNFFNKHSLLVVIIFSAICFFYGTSYIRKNDIYFFTDIARDFLILEEIAAKKIVLIGPRASGIEGVFHGPLWAYLNFPAFYLGQGNPVYVGWFWIILTLLFLITTYFIYRHIANKQVAAVNVMLLAGLITPQMFALYNPFGALFLIPFLIFCAFKYQQTLKASFLCLWILTIGLIIQFQMAIGGPLLFISLFLIIPILIKNNKYKQLWCFLILLLPLSSFIIFDLRHNLAQTSAVFNFIGHRTNVTNYSFFDRFQQRFSLLMVNGTRLFIDDHLNIFNLCGTAVIAFFFYVLQQKKLLENKLKLKLKTEKLLLLKIAAIYYFGFYFISLFFNGMLLTHYWLPIVPAIYLIFSLAVDNLKSVWPKIILILCLISMLYTGSDFARETKYNVALVEDDWQFQKKMAETIFADGEKEFGYFIFTPDIFAYESKYAMSYFTKQNSNIKVSTYEKKPVTYLIIAPDPTFRKDILSSEWKKTKINIDKNILPEKVFTFADGYVIEKYRFINEEMLTAPNPDINDWLYFR